MKGVEEEWEKIHKEWAEVEEAKAPVQAVGDRERFNLLQEEGQVVAQQRRLDATTCETKKERHAFAVAVVEQVVVVIEVRLRAMDRQERELQLRDDALSAAEAVAADFEGSELDAHERALKEGARTLPELPSSDPDPMLLEREAASLPMIFTSVEAVRASGARIVTLDLRNKLDLGWYFLCLDQLAEGLGDIPAAVTAVTQRSSKDLARKVVERILLSFSVRLPEFDPFLPLDDFPAGTYIEARRHAVADTAREIVAGF
uniref:Uncharacterized protein n=1 Tax=Oryza brachyantha TaxID=4533 RepID=J3N231_ORYBR